MIVPGPPTLWRHDLTALEENAIAIAVVYYAENTLIPLLAMHPAPDKYGTYIVNRLWSHWRIYLRMTYGGEYAYGGEYVQS